ncbi:MAG: bifunctional phosphoribosyl-AMP cyclohydrolase/phosphoribosyl-ATP diphosphatase HisIE [Actinobacteria bacterium]|nr:bifunctional phosphoribosyl-AMP cyclohydrolase/phosphoribosyl-ATP diphosphatase HisIE [Actinomycetota bacterium]OJU85709.1 MAG: bifunctional phosphoribosyl-AMP cyclohydrolase/phosphoribosyl-ATP pyrophosphatase [Solirubrobacterales bacterium 70-9]
MFSEISFDERGLVPCVVQDESTGEVLMLAYLNEKALQMTVDTGEMHFYSRSRDEIWRKGETSGATMAVRRLRYDCDGDAVLAIVAPTANACHTGERSCFYREVGGAAAPDKDAPAAPGEPRRVVHEALPALERTLKSRAAERPEGSYTVQLLDDPTLIGEKVEEEAEEVVRAAREETDERVAEEAADVLYHLAVLLAARGVPQSAVFEELNDRAG